MESFTIEKLWREAITELKVMPCCGLPIRYYPGPEGGLCQNICCAHCGAKWNIGPLTVQRIDVTENGFQPPKPPAAA